MNGPVIPTPPTSERNDTLIMPDPADDLKRAAREALDAHDALRAAEATEPPRKEDGMPYDRQAWLTWQEAAYRPSYALWARAMDRLARALGEPGMSRHPSNFRARCEEILR